MSKPTANEVLQKLCETIEATGGVMHEPEDAEKGGNSVFVPVADEEWSDLASAYLDACAVLGREPMVEACDDGTISRGHPILCNHEEREST